MQGFTEKSRIFLNQWYCPCGPGLEYMGVTTRYPSIFFCVAKLDPFYLFF